jgi:hypothetical protein
MAGLSVITLTISLSCRVAAPSSPDPLSAKMPRGLSRKSPNAAATDFPGSRSRIAWSSSSSNASSRL